VGWHNHRCRQLDAFAVIVEAVAEDQVTGRFGQDEAAEGSEGHEQSTGRILVVRKAPAVFVVWALQTVVLGHNKCGAGAPARD